MREGYKIVLCTALLAALAVGSAIAQTGTCVEAVPCSDPRGCPDLIVDPNDLAASWFVENQRFNKRHCSVLEGEVLSGLRTLLRFTSTTPNIGLGTLFVGNPLDHPEWFELETCHQHEHFREYADYRLWTPEGYQMWQTLRSANPNACPRDLLGAHPEVAQQLVVGRKQGFCVVDLFPYLASPCPPDPLPSAFPDGNCGFQGISVCWADSYHWSIDGQWIDVTDSPDGQYVLELEVNAERFFTESDYGNNSAAIPITLVKPIRRGRR